MLKRVTVAVLLIAAVMAISVIPAFAVPTSTMRLGSKGVDVIELQSKLVENGYLEKKYATGFFGPKTEEAVKKYQKDNNISQTGIVAEKTIEALFIKKELTSSMVLRNGDENGYVKTLQQALSDLGYLKADNVTGYYGTITENAVKKFQKDNGIKQTGVAAEKTISAINSKINFTKLEEGKVYRSGDEGEDVKRVQKRLVELGYLDAKYVTGYYGAITVSAVKKFQKNNQISETGTVAQLTIKAMNSASAKDNSEDSDIPAGLVESIAKPGSLRYGDKGAQVVTLQKNLKTLGYFSGTATGEFGNVTKQAVIKFQKAYSLTADGIAGSKTLSKIKAAISGSAKPNTSTSSTTGSSSSVSGGVSVTGYKSANMEIINQALKTLNAQQLADVKLMAQVIKRECGGKSYKCQLAVGSVIMNRVKHNNMTVRQVIYSPNQFSTANSTLEKETYSTTTYYAAIEAYMGIKPVGNCRYFCSKSVRYTCWAGKNRTYYTTIDSECFFL